MTEAEAIARFYESVRNVRARCAARPTRYGHRPRAREAKSLPPEPPPVIRKPRFNKDGKLLLWMKRRDAERVARYQEMRT